ncbi:MAG: 4-alpha-glucanotransferase [Actinobacteria bacterium]|uniref:4-alpha-glucanotransferase n=1 Tax=freshwater metagenome TaxID=449393 RepID=A0A6J6EQI8_9ZZZZ|nr:4-alpha-glucanotransferase [Actinomycetota bacterium]
MDEWGITDGYHDVAGTWHPIDPAVRDRIRAAMGTPVPGRPLWFVEQGTHHTLWNDCELVLEDGTSWGVRRDLPPEVPLGYHDLRPTDGSPATRVIVHPRTCPEIPVGWGVAAQVYALWSERSWGIGDLRDLRDLATRVMAAGGCAVLVSPLHQPAPSLPQEPSPYYPSSRRAWNPMLLAIDAPVPERLRCAPGTLIDRDDVWIAKRSVLEAAFDVVDDGSIEPSPIACWNAHCDTLGADWQRWPADLAELEASDDWQRRARFHEWLQHRVADQLADVAATGVRLIGDLAVGFSPGGADAAEFAAHLALDMRVGAPPDKFNADGQEWGLPPFVPWKLRAALYEPFVDTVRAALRGVHGLRIDHVMGLFRQYWVPAGGSPRAGAYVRFPADELLAIVCLEATRAGAFVIGEDLGTVEQEVREMLAERRIAGTKVLWFEEETPDSWPAAALATVTTHDLPTAAGVWERGLTGDVADDEVYGRLLAVAPTATTGAEAAAAANAALVAGSSHLRLVTTDDLAGAVEQPNRPGLNDHPNWRIRLPVAVDRLL